MKTFLVGGAVRDRLMGLEPQDLDYVVVGATPDQMLADGFQQVGADFPVFLHPVTGHEYALARTEQKTGDGYLGFEVDTKDVSLEDDLSRRDLTINAMAMDEDGNLFDPFFGAADLEAKTLRHVSDFFADDPLRVIRLGRFFARYSDFSIHPATATMCKEMVRSGELNHLPVERFWAELLKVFKEEKVDRFFKFLWSVTADESVKFFRDLYGPFNSVNYGFMIAVALASKHVSASERVMIHTALTANPYRNDGVKTADTRTQALHDNLFKLQRLTHGIVTADGIFALLKAAKTWSDGSDLTNLRDAMQIANAAGKDFVLTPDDLMDAAFATKQITSADYLHIYGPGKALGAAIERGRKEAIMRVFNLREGDLAMADEV